jgi:hypothetical protein
MPVLRQAIWEQESASSEHDIKERKNTGEKNWESGDAKTKKGVSSSVNYKIIERKKNFISSRPEFVLLQKIEKNVWEKLHIDLGFLNKQTTAKYSMVLQVDVRAVLIFSDTI